MGRPAFDILGKSTLSIGEKHFAPSAAEASKKQNCSSVAPEQDSKVVYREQVFS